jgi:hypothetical protein
MNVNVGSHNKCCMHNNTALAGIFLYRHLRHVSGLDQARTPFGSEIKPGKKLYTALIEVR